MTIQITTTSTSASVSISSPLLLGVGDAGIIVEMLVQVWQDGGYVGESPLVITPSDLTDGNYNLTVTEDLYKFTLTSRIAPDGKLTVDTRCAFIDRNWVCAEVDLAGQSRFDGLQLINALRSVNVCPDNKCAEAANILSALTDLTDGDDCC